ncbi:hypothetical protein FJ365_05245 [Candidatus Dependentiae bacterium]|nr:hypothetical protein [Candidatus Dependentiae bacterium]
MDWAEFLSYVGMYVLDGVADLAKALIISLLERYLVTQTRGLMDTAMATWANIKLKISCLDCKKAEYWELWPEDMEQEVKKTVDQLIV